MNVKKCKKEIKVFNLSNLPAADFEIFNELQEDFKISTPEKSDKLEAAILKRGFKYAFIAWKDADGQMWIIDAHRRKEVLTSLRAKEYLIPPIPYYLIQAKNKKEAVEEIAYLNSEYAAKNPDTELFANFDIDLSSLDIVLPGFEEFDLNKNIFGFEKECDRPSLIERFLIPPFSVFDTRQGYWQERKKQWILGLGIRSELGGRDTMGTSGSLSGNVPRYYEYKESCEKRLGKKISNNEFERNHLSAYLPKDSIIANTVDGGILSVFDPVLTEICYEWFCTVAGSIFDPFAGGSVRGIVASKLGFNYHGIDLRKEQVDENKKQAKQLLDKNDPKPKWITGNSINCDTLVSSESYDMIFSCPPYFDLEVYSDNPEDLSNLDYDEFKIQYKEIIKKSANLLKEDRFAIFVVGEIRDKNGIYRDFVNFTKECFVESGLHFYNDIILLNVAGSLPIRVARAFNSTRKIGKVHQNVLVFYKGNLKAIKDNFKALDFSLVEENE